MVEQYQESTQRNLERDGSCFFSSVFEVTHLVLFYSWGDGLFVWHCDFFRRSRFFEGNFSV